jgi:parallel beta-helix repeat protein
LLAISALALAYSIHSVKASGTVYIRADGSIDPPTAPIYTGDNTTYMLTADIATVGIVIERDNIVLNGAGYTVQGTGSGIGISITGRTNTTVQNTTIKAFDNGIMLVSSSSVSIAGNTITNNKLDGIVLSSSSDNSIVGNNITGSSFDGVYLSSSSDNSIVGNNITGNSIYGVYLYSSSNNSIAGNNIANNGDGVYLYSSSLNNTITGNTITNNGDGLLLDSSSNNSVAENSITANRDDGVDLSSSSNTSIVGNTITSNGFDGVYLSYSSNTTIAGNTMTTSNWYGIDLEYSTNISIAGNTITINNYYGVYLHYSSNNSIVADNITISFGGVYLSSSSDNSIAGNNIANNGNDGGLLLDSSSNNSIYHNNFLNNTVQAIIVTTASNTWDNGYPSGGNYWSDYTGADLYSGPYQNESGSDGIGDTPYVIDANNGDHYPLMNPWVPYENGTIYICADGSVDPSGAPILREGDLYTLTSNISSNADGIVIERDNILVDGAGQTLEGTQASANGIQLTGGSNVTIENIEITAFQYGIWLVSSFNDSISGNNITNNNAGVYLDSSSNNSISGNIITANNWDGIWVNCSSSDNTVSENNITNNWNGVWIEYSSDNSVSENNVTANNGQGVWLDISSNNTISRNNMTNNWYGVGLDYSDNNSVNGNNITNNGEGIYGYSSTDNSIEGNNITSNADGIYLTYSSSDNSISGNNIAENNATGIMLEYSSSNNSVNENNIANDGCGLWLVSSSNNEIYHNTLNNTSQVYSLDSANVWDDGYPSGGNFWSDYTGVDFYGGQYQNETGSDGIGDTPYVIDANNQDNYPLMKPYVPCDVVLASLTSAPTSIPQGFGCLITVTVTNQGNFVETSVIVYANETDTGNVTVIGTFENVILNSGDSTTLTFTWNTSGFDLGTYTISAYATPVAGETNVANNTFVGNAVQIILSAGGGAARMPYMD